MSNSASVESGSRSGRTLGDTLLVFAHGDEASAFTDVAHLVTGVGKISAASTLTHALAGGRQAAAQGARTGAIASIGTYAQAENAARGDSERERSQGPIRRVVVLGTAGVIRDGDGSPEFDRVLQITAAVQHDFSLPSPKLHLAGDLILPKERTATIATGDVFVSDDGQRAMIAGLGADLVDMESYAYANVCARFDVPVQIFKVPSDFADSATSDETWDTIVHEKSRQLRAFWDAYLAP